MYSGQYSTERGCSPRVVLITRKGISLNPAKYTTKVMQQYVAKTTKYIADNASLHTVLPYIVSEVLCTLCV